MESAAGASGVWEAAAWIGIRGQAGGQSGQGLSRLSPRHGVRRAPRCACRSHQGPGEREARRGVVERELGPPVKRIAGPPAPITAAAFQPAPLPRTLSCSTDAQGRWPVWKRAPTLPHIRLALRPHGPQPSLRGPPRSATCLRPLATFCTKSVCRDLACAHPSGPIRLNLLRAMSDTEACASCAWPALRQPCRCTTSTTASRRRAKVDVRSAKHAWRAPSDSAR